MSLIHGRPRRIAPSIVTIFATVLACLLGKSPGRAQEKPAHARPTKAARNKAGPTPNLSELEAIRAESRAFVAAFNKKDAKAIALLWTKDGEYIDDVGRRYIGREAIEKGYEAFFSANPKAKLRVMIDSVRLLSGATAIEDGRAVMDPPPAGVPGFGKYTAVHVKINGKWLMASVRDTHVETPSAFRNVADLEWLIGSWVAEDQGVKVESVCRWIANKSFVERKYTVTGVDGSKTSGLQIVGWNAKDGHIQSWDFSPDGGHAVGLWSPMEGGWKAEIRGVTGDGVLTTSVNSLRRLDDNAYAWRSVRRTAAGQALPDTGEVVLKRKPAKK